MNIKTVKKIANQVIKTQVPPEIDKLAKYVNVFVNKKEYGIRTQFELPYYELVRKKNIFRLECGGLGCDSLWIDKITKERLSWQFENLVEMIKDANRKYCFVEIGKCLIKYRRSKIKDRFIEILSKIAERGLNISAVKNYAVPEQWIKSN